MFGQQSFIRGMTTLAAVIALLTVQTGWAIGGGHGGGGHSRGGHGGSRGGFGHGGVDRDGFRHDGFRGDFRGGFRDGFRDPSFRSGFFRDRAFLGFYGFGPSFGTGFF
ncbi:MAG TPA: hypothetical protein VG099_10205, partial [Gemmataceae bacterium]|nr:hypothetical protein [Gemmataceae bacterium]